MLASKLTVSKELTESNLNVKEMGRLRWNRVKEMDGSGELQFIKNRKDLAESVGYGRDEARGTSWASNMIRRGYVKETLLTRDGKNSTYEYHLTGNEPDFDYKSVRRAKHNRTKVGSKPAALEENTPLSNTLREALEPATILIKKGQMTITITGVDVAEAVNKLLK